MTLLADQAAVAIENARLYEETRQSLAQVQAANRQLEGLDALRQQYLRNVSHEFRTPLTVIKGYTDHLAQGAPQDEGAFREILRILGESSDRLIELVDTLIDVSRLEQSRRRAASGCRRSTCASSPRPPWSRCGRPRGEGHRPGAPTNGSGRRRPRPAPPGGEGSSTTPKYSSAGGRIVVRASCRVRPRPGGRGLGIGISLNTTRGSSRNSTWWTAA
jgi:hypothetical protein